MFRCPECGHETADAGNFCPNCGAALKSSTGDTTRVIPLPPQLGEDTGEFTDPGYLQALEYYQQLLPYMTPNADGVKPDMARSMFAMGQAAIYYGELIEIPYIKSDADDLNFGPLAAGSTIKAIALFKDTGLPSTSPLLCYLDEVTGFPFATNGGEVAIPWSDGPAKILSLV